MKRLRPYLLALTTVLLMVVYARPASAGLAILMPTEKDEESWHAIDRRHFLTLVSSTARQDAIADALFSEWVVITDALARRLLISAYVDPDLGFRVYDSGQTLQIHTLSLAKKARENALTEYALSGRFGGYLSYPGLYEAGDGDGTNLDQNGLSKARGARVATVDDLVSGIRSIKGLPKGTLNGFSYFISPFVFPVDIGHAFSSHQAGPDEWAAVSALPAGLDPEGFPKDTVIHETGHLLHFEYMGSLDQEQSLWDEYSRLRGRPLVDSGRWENLAVENFAEDVRVSMSPSKAAHRGAFPIPDAGAKQAISALVLKAVSTGSKARFKITDIRFDDGVTSLRVSSAPASTGVFVTRKDRLTVSGYAEAKDGNGKPHFVLSSMGAWDDTRVPLEGFFSVSLNLPEPGAYSLRKGYLDQNGKTLWQYDTGMVIVRLPPEGSRNRDISSHWGRFDLEELIGLNVIGGYPDGSIRPDSPVTRAEFIKMLVKITGQEPLSVSVPYADIQSHWSRPYVAAALKAGYLRMAGFGALFGPDARLTRGEMAQMLARVTGVSRNAVHTFSDLGRSESLQVSSLVSFGILRGFPDGRFQPRRSTSRAEASTALVRLEKVMLGN